MISAKTVIYLGIAAVSFLAGWFLSSYGPLIPFYSRETGLDETHYSYIMMCRSVGIIAGLFAAKYLPNYFQTKAILIQASLASVIFFYLNTLSLSDFSLAATYILTSFHSILGNAVGIGVIFQIFPEQAAYFIQLRGFIFGVGALIGPKMVSWFQLDSYIVLAFCNVLPLGIFALYSIPNIQTASQPTIKSDKPPVSLRAELMICGLMFTYAGMENGLASWIPTYSIKAGVAQVEGSSFYSLIFWVPNCFSRLAWMYLPGRVIHKLRMAISIIVVVAAVCVCLQVLELYSILCLLAPISFGVVLANVDSFCLALPSDHGFEPNNNNTAHFMLANAAAEGLINMPIGLIMSMFGFKVLFIIQMLLSVMSFVLVQRAQFVTRTRVKQSSKRQNLARLFY